MSKMRQPIDRNAEALEGEFEASGRPPERDGMIEGGMITSASGGVMGEVFVRTRAPLPRNMVEVEKNLLAEAEASGDLFLYSWGEGDNHIEGGSIKLANAMIRHYGNMLCLSMPVQETATSWIFTARIIDTQTGMVMDRSFKQSKRSIVAGKMDAERKDDIRFQIGQSKANRNAILNATPEYLKAKAIEAAKRGLVKFIEEGIKTYGLAKMQDTAIKKLATHGVSEERILAKFGHAKRSALDPEQLGKLSIAFRALNDGQERAEDLFPPLAPESTLKPGETMGEGGEIIPPGSTKQQLDEMLDKKPTASATNNSDKPLSESPRQKKEPENAENSQVSDSDKSIPTNSNLSESPPGPPEVKDSAAYLKAQDEILGITTKAGLNVMRKNIKLQFDNDEISADEFAALEILISERREGLAK